MKLPAGQNKLALPLPDNLAQRNVLVEVTAGGKSRSLPYYANAMDVRLTENYGQLRAADANGKPLPKVYVKVYARTADGQVKFYREGTPTCGDDSTTLRSAHLRSSRSLASRS